MCVRGGFFSRAVSVTVEPGEEGELQVMMVMMMMMMMMMMITYYQVMIGSLSVVLVRRDDLLQQLVTPAVGGVVLGHLAGSLYSGLVTSKQDCGVRCGSVGRGGINNVCAGCGSATCSSSPAISTARGSTSCWSGGGARSS